MTVCAQSLFLPIHYPTVTLPLSRESYDNYPVQREPDFTDQDNQGKQIAPTKVLSSDLTKTQQNAGCSPVLLTSLARRTFSSEHITSDSLGPYSAETIKVASALGLPVGLSICATINAV